MAFFQNFVRNLGSQNAPFGFDAMPMTGSPNQYDPAYNSGLRMIGNVGLGMLAQMDKNPLEAFGRSYLNAQDQAQEQNRNQYVAAEMMSAAEEKKQKRQEEQAAKAEREAFLKTLTPDQQMKARSVPGYLEKLVGATDPALQEAEAANGAGGGLGMTPIPLTDGNGGWAVGQLSPDGGVMVNGKPAGPQWKYDPYGLNSAKAGGTAEGKIVGGAKGVLTAERANSEWVKGKIDDIINDPSLPDNVGWNSYRPDMLSSNSMIAFRTKMAEIDGQAFIQARTVLKGGGAITDFESKKAEAAYNAAKVAIQSGNPQDLKDALTRFKEAIDAGMVKLEAQASGGAAPAAGGAPAEDPLGLR